MVRPDSSWLTIQFLSLQCCGAVQHTVNFTCISLQVSIHTVALAAVAVATGSQSYSIIFRLLEL